MQIEEIFGVTASQDIDFLIININELPVNNKNNPQYLLAGILFKLLEIPFGNEIRVLIFPPRIINETTRYMAITIQFFSEE